ncbi:hypothetical protein [Kitasatospora griseola]
MQSGSVGRVGAATAVGGPGGHPGGSPYALSHAFLREFGTTPGRYRDGS